MNAKEIFHNKWVSTLQTDDGYVYNHETRCNGKIVAIFPFVSTSSPIQYLARYEATPCHQNDEIYFSSITGGVDDNDIEGTAIKELEEEAGIIADKSELIDLGTIYPSKSQDTVIHLFGIDIAGKKIGKAHGDGSLHEQNAYCELETDLLKIVFGQSPLPSVMFMRLVMLNKIKLGV